MAPTGPQPPLPNRVITPLRPRYFITIDIDISVAERLMTLQHQLEPRLVERGLIPRWTHPEQLHLSMKDLGELDEALIPHVELALERLVEPLFPFQIQNLGVLSKPALQMPRMLYVPLDDKGAEVLSLLHKALERELEHIGVMPDKRPFHPALLLGRLKTLTARADMGDMLEGLDARRHGTSTIKDFALTRASHVDDGVRHEVVNRFTLGGRHEPI